MNTDTVQQARLRALLASEQKILKSQEWQDGTIKNRRADYKQVAEEIKQLRAAGVMLPEEIETIQNKRGGVARVILVD